MHADAELGTQVRLFYLLQSLSHTADKLGHEAFFVRCILRDKHTGLHWLSCMDCAYMQYS